jgi:hypothetical protein
VFLDISTVKKLKGQKKLTKSNWRIMVDKRTQLKFLEFFTHKDDMVEPTCIHLNKWKQAGMPVKYIHMDNAGKNYKLHQACSNSEDWKLNINYEITARDTSQQNHLAELGFAVLANHGRTLMIRANCTKEVQYQVWGEAFQCATLLDGLDICDIDGVVAMRYVHFAKENLAFAHPLRTWGEAGMVNTKTATTAKLANRGVQ